MRLHPVDDGLIPEPSERGITRRDRNGNKLVDVINPKTGFCVGVTSPLMSGVTKPGTISGGTSPIAGIEHDLDSATFYELVPCERSDGTVGKVGLVIRLTTDGDEPLKTTRVRVVETGEIDRSDDCVGRVRRALSTRACNDQAAEAVLRAMGHEGPITSVMRQAALEMIALERSLRA